MVTETTATGKSFLVDLARGGFAESFTPEQRRQIHIPTELDEYISDALEKGKQIVLTGNPGDGKTQHILMQKDSLPDEGYFYLLDASEYANYRELLDEWEEAYQDGLPGLLAINDGPLYSMISRHSDDYSFLDNVRVQLENQIVYQDKEAEQINFDDIVVVDLNNRNVLSPKIVGEAIDKLVSDFAKNGHDHSGQCHIQYNATKLSRENIRDNFKRLLLMVGRRDQHFTVRDLINFIAYSVTAGIDQCITEFDSGYHYYNLAFNGDGPIFDVLREEFTSQQLSHPFVDSRLWATAETEIDPRDTEDAREDIEERFLELKRQFLFEDKYMDIGYSSSEMIDDFDQDFITHRNHPNKEQLIELINSYFRPGSTRRSDLQLWLSHRYRSKSSLALVSRTNLPKRDLAIREPKLHPAIRGALSYTSDHTILEYMQSEIPIRLDITRSLYQALSALNASIPYTLRARDEEQQILEFMEEIEYEESYSETTGEVSIKNTATGRIETIEVNDDTYQI